MKPLIKIENEPSFAKDPETGAIINTDLTALIRYKERKKILRSKDNEIHQMKNDINRLEEQLKTIMERIDG
jgi:hypothetical protein